MGLFVPILRLVMLFLNVYDSYKTLKDPPPSSRNSGRPSIRAMSQRKRDLKGCLAVTLTMYERVLESIVCLFIPFYDEFKSLALLFLILTRARGAEPIYLHLIRPLIKPYTRTLDAILETMLTMGDFLFALSTNPLRLILQWYHHQFGKHGGPLEVEQDSSSDSDSSTSNDVNTSELPSSFLASSVPALTDGPEEIAVRFPRRSSKNQVTLEKDTRRPSASRSVSRKEIPEASGSRQLDNSRTQRRRGTDVSVDTDIEPNFLKPLSDHPREGGASSSSRHEIWHPPKAAYEEEEREVPAAPVAGLPVEEQPQVDEWREYPAFPSAYPPTPIMTTSRLVPTSLAVPSSLYPPIKEESIQQDFHKSLLPPREPLNPSRAGDLSDKHNISFGISTYNDARHGLHLTTANGVVNDDSMSTDDYEDEEDNFNMTLRTPLQPLGSSNSRRVKIPLRLLVSPPSNSPGPSSAVSIPSRSSALTTADTGSSLRTDPSSDSSLSAPRPSMASKSVIGKKRSYPRSARSRSLKNRIRQSEEEEMDGSLDEDDPSNSHESNSTKSKDRRLISQLTSENVKQIAASASDTADDPVETTSTSSAADDNENQNQNEQAQAPIPPEPEKKRRKVNRRSPTSPRARVVHPSRPIRTRVSRYASPPPPRAKLLEVPPAEGPAKRSSVRLRTGSGPGSSARQVNVKEKIVPPSRIAESSSASAVDPPLASTPTPNTSKRGGMVRK